MPFMSVVCPQLGNVFKLRLRDHVDCAHDVLREGVGPVGRGHLHGDSADSTTPIRRSLPDHRLVKVPPRAPWWWGRATLTWKFLAETS